MTRSAEMREEDLGSETSQISQVSPGHTQKLLGPALATEFSLGFLWNWLDLHLSACPFSVCDATHVWSTCQACERLSGQLCLHPSGQGHGLLPRIAG